MPRSDPCNKKPVITSILTLIKNNNLQKLNVLDLGIGEGDFGALIKKNINIPVKLTGVEIWKKYKHPQWKLYDALFIEDVRDFLLKNKKKFDLVLLIDIIEHFNKNDGQKILNQAINASKRFLIISTPTTKYPQSEYNGNPYEKHKYFWSNKQFKDKGFRRIFSKKVITYVKSPKYATLGIYLFDKQNKKTGRKYEN